MTPTELTRSIVATRNELSDAMRRNPDNIYRRLPQAVQDAWDELALPQSFLVLAGHKLAEMIFRAMTRTEEGGES
jgi:hypothetical protein